tara:strand:- start:665 stop:862 length:198 start_codon:yes stop_codon:yes gene_type:complete
MEPVYVPRLTVAFTVELEVEYDPFKGRTTDQTAAGLVEVAENLLWETSPRVNSVTTKIIEVQSND